MKHITATTINMQPNINSTQLFHLKKFVTTKPFTIIQCDKNIGTAIISNEL